MAVVYKIINSLNERTKDLFVFLAHTTLSWAYQVKAIGRRDKRRTTPYKCAIFFDTFKRWNSLLLDGYGRSH